MYRVLFRVVIVSIFIVGFALDTYASKLLRIEVLDQSTAEPLIGASVVDLLSKKGAATDVDGFAQFYLESQEFRFAIHYLGYYSDTVDIFLTRDTSLVIQLQEIANELETFEVTSKYTNRSNGVVGIDLEYLEKLPTFFGEREIIKAIQTLPGVQSGSEGSTSLFVRGGSSDQNLVTLDGVPLFHLSHLFGVLSVFNSDVVQSAELYKNYFSSAYPSRLTSALSVFSKSPSFTEKHFSYQIGVLNTKVYFETPIIKDKLATYIALRGCHAGLYIKPITKSQYKLDDEKGYISYFFYDINAGLHYKINSKNQLKMNFFFTDDRYIMFQEEERIGRDENIGVSSIRYRENKLYWNNLNASIHHQNQYNPSTFINQKVYLSQYQLKRGNNRIEEFFAEDTLMGVSTINATQFSSVSELGYQIQLDKIKEDHTFKIGMHTAWRWFNPDKSLFEEIYDETILKSEFYNLYKIFNQEYAVFVDYQLKKKVLDFYTGIRGVYYKNGNYHKASFLPRVSLEFKLPHSAIIQLSSQINEQHLHMVNGSIGDVMKDYWVPANHHAPSETSWQNSISYRQQKAQWEWSIDVFYRKSTQQTESANTYNFRPNDVWETNIISGGIGRAYGAEFYLSKKWKKVNLTLAYNLSKSERKFNELNRGQWFPYTHDRRHDLSSMISYKINEKLDISLAWVYGSGRPYSMADVVYPSLSLVDFYGSGQVDHTYLNGFSEQIKYNESRNNRNLASFHHLDFGLNYKWKKNKWQQTINFSVYNIYNRKNVFAILEKHSGTGADRKMRFQSITLLPILPSISYAVGF